MVNLADWQHTKYETWSTYTTLDGVRYCAEVMDEGNDTYSANILKRIKGSRWDSIRASTYKTCHSTPEAAAAEALGWLEGITNANE